MEIIKLKVPNNAIMGIKLDVLVVLLILDIHAQELHVLLSLQYATISSDKLDKNVITEGILVAQITARFPLVLLVWVIIKQLQLVPELLLVEIMPYSLLFLKYVMMETLIIMMDVAQHANLNSVGHAPEEVLDTQQSVTESSRMDVEMAFSILQEKDVMTITTKMVMDAANIALLKKTISVKLYKGVQFVF